MNGAVSNVSVVICAYTERRWDDLVAAVESVHRQITPPREILVVIDHNPRLLAHTQANLKGVVVVTNTESQGLSGARNSGISMATGDVIAFLDDDGIATPEWLVQIVAAYADTRVAGVGGTIEPLWLGVRPSWFPDEFIWVVGCTYRGMPTTTGPVRNLIGCNMSFRREVFKAVGGFRSGIGRLGTRPVGCEETEFCIRVSQRWPHKILLYEPRAIVHHRVPPERGRWRYFSARCYSEGLSKAQVAREVGTKDALRSEKAYATKVLPRGVVQGLRDAILHADVSGWGRATAITSGFTATLAGYAIARVCGRFERRQGERGFRRPAECKTPWHASHRTGHIG